MSAACLFIADLHLNDEADPVALLARQFIDTIEPPAQLYILGDLFEYWIGDDAGISRYPATLECLRRLSARGCLLSVMHGNRDFLLGAEFADLTGARLIRDDYLIIRPADRDILLMHGDTLCTADTEYQSMRKIVRDPQWQADFLKRPVHERERLAVELRQRSQQASTGKSATIMDVSDSAVQQAMQQHRCGTLIHGHTHRPAVHHHSQPADSRRYVLGDWRHDHAQYASHDGQVVELLTYPVRGLCE